MLVRPACFVGSLSALLGVVTKLDEFLVLFLRQDSGEGLFPALLRNFDFFGLVLRALAFGVLGLAAAIGIAALAARFSGRALDEIFPALARAYS
ncbi:MAG: hypothetical protein ACRD21_10155, partial [Vicinamibacteria bacterium]